MLAKVKSRTELVEIIGQAKCASKKTVFTNGCFDLLHVGHIRYLAAAKACGDLLVVAVNSDASVRSIKGELRPLVPQDQRAELLAALEMVDYVVIFAEPDPGALIKELRPDVLIKGSDWAADKIIGRETVEADGGRVERIAMVAGSSTTNLIKIIVDRYGREGKNG